ncbi:hypothetical protein ACX122_13105 [Kosakonia cowanii]|uniref:Uncharacterized protein n=1 Tax=Enterobacter cloacae S611 TaxID=1399146 RepID=A0ABN0Q3K5_ENTCL|nr:MULTISPECIES: hypothetical protein [Kosakonia]AZI87759.1 hypothetical protein EH164_12110 [Kosakonia sp. CCTCC M2018092]ESS56555.1 hypothetical protein EDP2_612 [Enterobacter cloacae S611]MDH2910936.1 hypothetical protein [Kosakonia sp. HypNH10]
MTKNVVVIRAGGKVEQVSVEDNAKSVTFKNEQSAFLEIPIEPWELDGETYFVARFSDLVTQQETEQAIRKFH